MIIPSGSSSNSETTTV